jgi:hypothetical protein
MIHTGKLLKVFIIHLRVGIPLFIQGQSFPATSKHFQAGIMKWLATAGMLQYGLFFLCQH